MTPARRAAINKLKARDANNYGAQVECSKCHQTMTRKKIPEHFRAFHSDKNIKPSMRGNVGRPFTELFKDKNPLNFK